MPLEVFQLVDDTEHKSKISIFITETGFTTVPVSPSQCIKNPAYIHLGPEENSHQALLTPLGGIAT